MLDVRRVRAVLFAIGVCALLALVALSVALPLPAELLMGASNPSLRVEARDGSLLRAIRRGDGALAEWIPLEGCPKFLADSVIAVEDRRFEVHPGIDPLAMLRALGQWLNHGHIVSGASTLTMQLARQLRPHPRTLWGKLQETALALRIEQTLTKRQILEQYLNRVDFGPNLRGVAAAARGYFDKPVAALSNGELALLAGLPQSPSGYAPTRNLKRALDRRTRVLNALREEGRLTDSEVEQANVEAVAIVQRRPSFGAPHFVTALVSGAFASVSPSNLPVAYKTATRLRTTLDPILQKRAETAISSVLASLSGQHVTSAALLMIDNTTGDVLAYVGSPDFYNVVHQGQVDGVRARRQPGSTLKPFVYGAAFEQLGYHASTVLPDLELTLQTETGPYRPANFDGKFHGPVRLREALGNSLNVPAVHTAARLGAKSLLAYLRRLGFSSLIQAPEFYGPALALGDGEVTLLELVRAYRTLARGGLQIPLRFVVEVVENAQVRRFEPGVEERILPASVAASLTDILKDKQARLASFGPASPLEFDFDVAAKTGTSKGFRDNWAVGYTERVTIGVWVGNFDNSPMLQVSGITGAAPLFHAMFSAESAGHRNVTLPIPRTLDSASLREQYHLQRIEVCPLSGQARGDHCPHGIVEYVPSTALLPTCDWHRELVLDIKNGLMAGPDCSTANVVRRAFEVLPNEFAEWAIATNRPRPPTDFSPNCPAPTSTDAVRPLRIDTPVSGSRYVLDPEVSPSLQRLRVLASAPQTIETLTLYAGERVVGTSKRPFEFLWPLEAGLVQLVVTTARGERSEPVTIEVRSPN